MADVPCIEEVKAAVSKLNCGKSPGINGLQAEIFKCAGPNLMKRLADLLQMLLNNECVPQDWRDALMVVLYKGKRRKGDCENYRAISLLSVVGKVLCRILLDRLLTHIADDFLSESQCGCRSERCTIDMISCERCTIDMISTAKQLQEKCLEQQVGLYQVFIDLSKAFHTVNRGALCKIVIKLGCPQKFISILKLFHYDMNTIINFGGELAEPIKVENGMKQGIFRHLLYFLCILLWCLRWLTKTVIMVSIFDIELPSSMHVKLGRHTENIFSVLNACIRNA